MSHDIDPERYEVPDQANEIHSTHLEHSIELEPVPVAEEAEFKVTPELEAAIASALADLQGRSYSGRHPELGKMIKCQVCQLRHRENERKCEQKFKYLYSEDILSSNGTVERTTDFYATAIPTEGNPTKNQVIGAAAFAKKRFHPHVSRTKLMFIERTRVVFERLGFSLNDDTETFQKNLQKARVVAAREIRNERELSDRFYRRQADRARRVNRGLAKNGTR